MIQVTGILPMKRADLLSENNIYLLESLKTQVAIFIKQVAISLILPSVGMET